MSNNRIIAVFTGNRAEYGLQYPILRAIDRHPNLDYRLLVSGAHLDSDFGNTLQEINRDGFRIDQEIKIEMDAKSLFSTAQDIGSGILEISRTLADIQPNMVVVYADRFEGLAAVVASSQMNIPTAHIEGGDLTEGGALDDSVRHAMTKLAHLHFTTNQQATNRIIAMGEEDWRVHTVGLPAIDLITERNYAKPEEVLDRLSLTTEKPIVIFTQHSVTTEYEFAEKQLKPSLDALEELAAEDVQIIVTYPNNDAGGHQIIQMLEELNARQVKNVQVHQSLGRNMYHGVLGLAVNKQLRVACVGNSSSGIKETPAFNCPTVNIGSRQDGRLRGDNVIDVNYSEKEIKRAINKCLFDEKFRLQCQQVVNPYWLGNAGSKIASVLADTPLDDTLLRKRMTLQGVVHDGWYK